MAEITGQDLRALLAAQRAAFMAEMPVGLAVRKDRMQRAIKLLVENGEALCAALSDDFGHRSREQSMLADIVGPICESADCFARDRQIQELGEGEYLAFMSAGAYGHVMASRYNTRPLPAEVLVRGSSFEQVTARETFEQMIANEKIPAFLK